MHTDSESVRGFGGLEPGPEPASSVGMTYLQYIHSTHVQYSTVQYHLSRALPTLLTDRLTCGLVRVCACTVRSLGACRTVQYTPDRRNKNAKGEGEARSRKRMCRTDAKHEEAETAKLSGDHDTYSTAYTCSTTPVGNHTGKPHGTRGIRTVP